MFAMRTYKISWWRPLVVIIFCLIIIPIIPVALYLIADFWEKGSVPLLIISIGMLAGGILCFYWMLYATSLYFRKQSIVITDEGIEVNIDKKTASWGTVLWSDVESVSVNNKSSLIRAGRSPHKLVSLNISKSSPLFKLAKKSKLIEAGYLSFNIFYFQNNSEIADLIYRNVSSASSRHF